VTAGAAARETQGSRVDEPQPFVPYRWVEIISGDHAFAMVELDRLREYGFTGATLWTSFEWPRREDIDNYYYTLPLAYRKHADLNACVTRK